ncbi:ARMT1-like domain-containing protein [Desulfoplanes sp.]
MSSLPYFSSTTELFYGTDPHLDAWLLYFFTENNIEYAVKPDLNASPEQIRFMVDIQSNQVFAPCSDWMLKNLLGTELTTPLREEYRYEWRLLVRLVHENIKDKYTRRKILSLSRHKFRDALGSTFLIPSRLLKHLVTIFLSQCGMDDPMRDRKRLMNKRANDFIYSQAFTGYLSACPSSTLGCQRIQDLRWELDILELKRLFSLSTCNMIWEKDIDALDARRFCDETNGFDTKFDAVFRPLIGPQALHPLRILFMPDTSGGIMFDLLIIKSLLRQGHRVVLALKEGFYFESPTFWDKESDPFFAMGLSEAVFLSDNEVSKNKLLKTLRENSFVVISDGTRERLNLYRTSVTFARSWKESDLVIAKGSRNYRRLILNTHSFTRNIISYFRHPDGRLGFYLKKRSPRVVKITEKQILSKAEKIMSAMRRKRSEGELVMFYSAIIGSVPGQLKTAKRVLNTFVGYLRSKLGGALIINPAEHFEQGMDGDDLMYMWEKVQRSGLIDVWRFQTVTDIEKSFELMGEKVPSVWMGKDATFSTGCTKEMHIALDVQKKHPELQIIGPSPEKFFRRRDYGIGKYFDTSLDRT